VASAPAMAVPVAEGWGCRFVDVALGFCSGEVNVIGVASELKVVVARREVVVARLVNSGAVVDKDVADVVREDPIVVVELILSGFEIPKWEEY